MSKNNIDLLEEVMKCSADIDMLKCTTTDLNDIINLRPVNTLDNTKYNTSTQLNYDLDRLDSEILKIHNAIININTQLDDLYSDIQHIKDVLNI